MTLSINGFYLGFTTKYRKQIYIYKQLNNFKIIKY